ncbi:MAG: hypothetical protein ACI3XS_01485 [Eubacteriales bacterium]
MYGDDSYNMPLGFAMALAGNPRAMNAFMKMEDEKQDQIIEQAKSTKTKREMQQLVDRLVIN